jgi:hypothetical protein
MRGSGSPDRRRAVLKLGAGQSRVNAANTDADEAEQERCSVNRRALENDPVFN